MWPEMAIALRVGRRYNVLDPLWGIWLHSPWLCQARGSGIGADGMREGRYSWAFLVGNLPMTAEMIKRKIRTCLPQGRFGSGYLALVRVFLQYLQRNSVISTVCGHDSGSVYYKTEYGISQNGPRMSCYLPDKDIDLDAAALVEPLAVGTQGALSMEPKEDDNVVVPGAGTIGLCAAVDLINHGIKNVIVCDRNDWKLAIARKMGAKTINVRDEDRGEHIKTTAGRALYGIFILPPRCSPPSTGYYGKLSAAPS